jgi:hypothetical protein
MREIFYRGFVIVRNPPEARQYKWNYTHKDYSGPEDSNTGDCRTLEECIETIDEIYEIEELDQSEGMGLTVKNLINELKEVKAERDNWKERVLKDSELMTK